jgi:hypothetical protein
VEKTRERYAENNPRRHTLSALSTAAPRRTIQVRLLVGGVFLSEGIQKFLFPGALGVGRFEDIGRHPFPGFLGPVCGATRDSMRGAHRGRPYALGARGRVASIHRESERSCSWKPQECYYSGSPSRIKDSSLHATGVNSTLASRVGPPSPGTPSTTASESSGVVSTIGSDSRL